MKVFKFGGASVQDAAHIRNVATILEKYKGEKLLLVISATGKTTNALEKVVSDYFDKDGNALETLNAIKSSHNNLAEELMDNPGPLLTDINDTFVEIEWQIEDESEDNFDFAYDQMVSVGELVSSKIVTAYLQEKGFSSQWLDARDVIITDNDYREANVDWKTTQERISNKLPKLFEKTDIVVSQGFIGSSSENFSTTLGREGSDYSAAIFGYCLDAHGIYIWKDVAGILTGDPRLFDDVTKIDELSYREAIEMAYYGAKVIHPKTIKPLQNKKISLHVRPFQTPDEKGTIISGKEFDTYPPIIVFEHNQSLLRIATRDFSFVAEKHMSLIFDAVAKHRIKVKLMKNTAINFILSVDSAHERIDIFMKELESLFQVEVQHDLELITIRNYNQETIDRLTSGRQVLFEERIPKTIQMVVKSK